MRKAYYILAVGIMLIGILMVGKFIFAPLILSIFFGILISPLVNVLEKWKINSIFASCTVVILLFTLLFGIVLVISSQYYNMAEQMPSMEKKMEASSNAVLDFVTNNTSFEKEYIIGLTNQVIEDGKSQLSNVFSTVWTSLSSLVSFLVLLPVFTLLVVIYRGSAKEFVKELSVQKDVVYKDWINALGSIKKVVRKYLLGLVFVIAILAFLNTLGLYLIGVPFALTLGVTSAVLSIIPYVGNLVGGGFAIFVALATMDNPYAALSVLILYVIVQFIEGNIITPKVMGDQIGLNPLIVIIALLVGGFLWGVIGMVLSIPIVAIFKVLLERKESLKPLVVLINDE